MMVWFQLVDLESSGQQVRSSQAKDIASSRTLAGGAFPLKDDEKKAAAEQRLFAKKNTGGLFTLRTVVSMLSERGDKGKQVGPPPQYRDSKLTRLLKNSFDGSGHVVVICMMSPALSSEEETLRTLSFACCVAKIRGPTTGKSALPKAFFHAKEEDETFLKPLFKLEVAAETLWHEVSPLPRLCKFSEYLPVSAAMLLDLLLQREYQLNNLLSELSEFKENLPPLPESTISSNSTKRAPSPEPRAIPFQQNTSAARTKSSESEMNIETPPSKQMSSAKSFKMKKSILHDQHSKEPADNESGASSNTINSRLLNQVWLRMRAVWRRLKSSSEKLEEARNARKSWRAAEDELAMDDLDFERASADRKGKPWRATVTMEAARRRVIKSGGRRAKRALEKYRGVQMHSIFQKKVNSLEETLKSVRDRLDIVAKLPSAAEKMEELSNLEREIEKKRSAALQDALQAQNEAIYSLNMVLEEGEESLKGKHIVLSSEEEYDEEEEENFEHEAGSTMNNGTGSGAFNVKVTGRNYRSSKSRKTMKPDSKMTTLLNDEFSYLSEEDRRVIEIIAALQEERDDDDGIQSILTRLWDDQIEAVSHCSGI